VLLDGLAHRCWCMDTDPPSICPPDALQAPSPSRRSCSGERKASSAASATSQSASSCGAMGASGRTSGACSDKMASDLRQALRQPSGRRPRPRRITAVEDRGSGDRLSTRPTRDRRLEADLPGLAPGDDRRQQAVIGQAQVGWEGREPGRAVVHEWSMSRKGGVGAGERPTESS
jgi:hypothetical protein